MLKIHIPVGFDPNLETTKFEQEDPALGELVKWYCQQPPVVQKRLNLDEAEALPKVGRNEPCPCGSTKKYKRCCGAT